MENGGVVQAILVFAQSLEAPNLPGQGLAGGCRHVGPKYMVSTRFDDFCGFKTTEPFTGHDWMQISLPYML